MVRRGSSSSSSRACRPGTRSSCVCRWSSTTRPPQQPPFPSPAPCWPPGRPCRRPQLCRGRHTQPWTSPRSTPGSSRSGSCAGRRACWSAAAARRMRATAAGGAAGPPPRRRLRRRTGRRRPGSGSGRRRRCRRCRSSTRAAGGRGRAKRTVEGCCAAGTLCELIRHCAPPPEVWAAASEVLW
jgi:hypothetical protein